MLSLLPFIQQILIRSFLWAGPCADNTSFPGLPGGGPEAETCWFTRESCVAGKVVKGTDNHKHQRCESERDNGSPPLPLPTPLLKECQRATVGVVVGKGQSNGEMRLRRRLCQVLGDWRRSVAERQ